MIGIKSLTTPTVPYPPETHGGIHYQVQHLLVNGTVGLAKCSVPCDYVPRRSYPLFRARGVLEALVTGPNVGSPEGRPGSGPVTNAAPTAGPF